MLKEARLTLAFLGLGLWAPALHFFLVRAELGPSAAFAAALAAALAGGLAAGGQDGPSAPLSFAAGCLLSGFVLLPAIGLGATTLSGAPLAACAFLPRGESKPPPGILAGLLAAAAAVALERCAGLLIGNTFYSAALVLAGLAAGAGAGLWAAEKLPAPPWILPAAGLFGVLLLGFFRFLGINLGGGEYVQGPLLKAWDLPFLAGQAALGIALWSGAAAWGAAKKGRLTVMSLAAALAGPACGLELLRLAGPAAAAAAVNLALISASLRAGGPAAAAALVLGLWFAAGDRHLFRDLWTYRLSAALPGGDLQDGREDAAESLQVYRRGETALLVQDGVLQARSPAADAHAGHLPLILRDKPSRVLFLGARGPRVLDAALTHEAEIDAADRSAFYPELLKALKDPKDPAVPAALLHVMVDSPRRLLSAPGPRYAAISIELTAPLASPANAFAVDAEALRAAKARLEPGGVLSVRIPRALFVNGPERILRTLTASFAHVAVCPFDDGLLALASDQAVDPNDPEAARRAREGAWIYDLRLESYLASKPCRAVEPSAALAGLAPDTDDRPRLAFPLLDMLRTSR